MNWLLIAGILVVVVAVVVFFVLPVFLIGRKTADLNSAEHLSELSFIMERLKSLAIKYKDVKDIETIFDETTEASTLGFRLAYTISRDESIGLYKHHISMSQNGSYVAEGNAVTFATWIAKFIAVDCDKMTILKNTNSDGAVRHVVFSLTEDEQQTFEKTSCVTFNPSAIDQSVWRELGEKRQALSIRTRQIP